VMKYLFGPVNSRRLGLSLGVDLVPYKTCPLNCVYCECGETTTLTAAITEYVPTTEVIAELDTYLSGSPRIDVITFSGSGEPTLHSGIGKVIGHCKDKYPQYKIAVLTNGVLLWNPVVRQSLARADIVIPSLDAVSPEVFSRIARPARDITPDRVVEGLVEFRKGFPGKIYLEVFIVPGLNDTESELAKLKEAFGRIKPDRLQINTLDRPGAEDWVQPADRERLLRIREFFAPFGAEIIGKPERKRSADRHVGGLEKAIIQVLHRRPSTLEDLCGSLGADRGAVEEILASMSEAGIITAERLARGLFYRMV
jgi:wyosine [tRNA(Phe)-imidazoG37] synthetase (radical SAM superfamily)